MLIIPPTALMAIQEAVVGATHGLVDQNGERVMIGTIDGPRLAMAAQCALQIAVGEVVWPADKPIERPRPRQGRGPFGGDW